MTKYLILSFLITSFSAFAQWECRSNLSGHLDSFKEDGKLSWGAELVTSGGYLSHSTISNAMAFYGLDYSKNNYQLYLEAGIKYWNQYDMDLSGSFSKFQPGLRELSYNYFTPNFDLSIGLQQMTLADYFLVNERALGASLSQKVGDFDLQFNAGTVLKGFSRNGTFCANCFLYDIVPSRTLPLGNTLGETNFAALSFRKKITPKDEKTSGGSDDEFSDFDDFESVTKSKAPFLSSYGAILYGEFGNYYSKAQLHTGATAEFNLGQFATLKAEGLYQYAENNQALLLYLQANKNWDWTNGNASSLQLTFLGKQNIDDNAIMTARFANLFLGEVFRMDAIDLPLLNVSAKHRFIDQQMSIKLQYSQQIKAQEMKELDFSVGKYFFNKHLRSTLITGVMTSKELTDPAVLAKVEIRYFF